MPRDYKQEYARLPTDSDVGVVAVEYALMMMGDRSHRELHVSPACAEVGEKICKQLLIDYGSKIQLDLVVDTELGTHEWFVLQTAGSAGP